MGSLQEVSKSKAVSTPKIVGENLSFLISPTFFIA